MGTESEWELALSVSSGNAVRRKVGIEREIGMLVQGWVGMATWNLFVHCTPLIRRIVNTMHEIVHWQRFLLRGSL